jgi:hypothetical protein
MSVDPIPAVSGSDEDPVLWSGPTALTPPSGSHPMVINPPLHPDSDNLIS